jgi:hypothetical protein
MEAKHFLKLQCAYVKISRTFAVSCKNKQWDFFGTFYCYVVYSTLLHLPPLRFHDVDAGIEPRTVPTLALAVRRSNLSDRSYPQSARSHPPKKYVKIKK